MIVGIKEFFSCKPRWNVVYDKLLFRTGPEDKILKSFTMMKHNAKEYLQIFPDAVCIVRPEDGKVIWKDGVKNKERYKDYIDGINNVYQ